MPQPTSGDTVWGHLLAPLVVVGFAALLITVLSVGLYVLAQVTPPVWRVFGLLVSYDEAAWAIVWGAAASIASLWLCSWKPWRRE